MAKWALITNGLVHETTNVDPHDRFPEDLEWVVCPKNVEQGYSYDGETFSAPPSPEPVTEIKVVFPTDLWRRMSEEEVVAVEQAMGSQTSRIQRIFNSATEYRDDDELWPLLETVATGLFGSERASEILAPSAIY